MRRRWFAALWVCANIWFVGQSVALADEASGTWTGELESHGSYYLERSTKVLVPTGRLSLEAPNGVRMNVAYLADVISSASVASGHDTDGVHVEVRQGVGAGAGKTLAVGENEISLGVSATHSWESDYISWLGGVNAGFLFNQKNTGISLGVSGVHDSIYMNINDATSRNFIGHLDGVTLNLGVTQVLSPVLTFGAGYQFVYLTGFLGNPYRKVQMQGAPVMERPPEERLRHNLELSAAWYLPGTATTLQGFARFYTDSWNLNAITPELRVYQQLGRDFNVRLRARYYLQGRADFALPADSIGQYGKGYTGPATSDPKLTEFDSLQLGIRISMAMTAFERTFMSWASRGVLDLSFDHQWTTIASSSFGNKNLFLILGGRLPF